MRKTANLLPLCFIKIDSKAFSLCSILSLYKNNNAFINEDGKWLLPYKPAIYRSLPFFIKRGNKKEESFICFDESLNCVVDNNQSEEANRIFKKNGEVTKEFSQFSHFLTAYYGDLELTNQLVKQIVENDLITEWSLKVKTKDKGIHEIPNIYKINEENFLKIPEEKISKLFKSRAFEIIYSQLISMDNIHKVATIQKQIMLMNEGKKQNETKKVQKSLRDKVIEKQKKQKKEELDNLVQNLMQED